MNKGLSSVAEIKDRCNKRNTKIAQISTTSHDDVFVVIFQDGTQANINFASLEELHRDTPSEYFINPPSTQLV